jgi:hypothetical protein
VSSSSSTEPAELQASAAESRRGLVGRPLAAEEEQGTGRAPGDALPTALALPRRRWHGGEGMEMGEQLPDLGGAKEQGRAAVVEEHRSRRESRGCRALGGPSLAALLARPETKGRGRHRPEREKDGSGSFFLPTCRWRRSFFACPSRLLCTMHMGICLSHFAMPCWSQSWTWFLSFHPSLIIKFFS